MNTPWDPLSVSTIKLQPSVVMRIRRDLECATKSPLPGIFVQSDENDLSLVHALISGPEGTPYYGGYFYFILRFPERYPMVPPMVKLMNTGNGTVRFNPNLYANGKVCLSILGTWSGPSWSPANTLNSIFLSIQTLLTPHPINNEPGFELISPTSAESRSYNVYLTHQTLQHALLDYLDNKVGRLPDSLKSIIVGALPETILIWESVCDSLKVHNGTTPQLPQFDSGTISKKLNFPILLQKLKSLSAA